MCATCWRRLMMLNQEERWLEELSYQLQLSGVRPVRDPRTGVGRRREVPPHRGGISWQAAEQCEMSARLRCGRWAGATGGPSSGIIRSAPWVRQRGRSDHLWPSLAREAEHPQFRRRPGRLVPPGRPHPHVRLMGLQGHRERLHGHTPSGTSLYQHRSPLPGGVRRVTRGPMPPPRTTTARRLGLALGPGR